MSSYDRCSMNVNHLGQIATRQKNLRSLKAGKVCCRPQKGRGLIHAVRRTAFHLQKPGTTGAPIWSPVVPQMLQVANPRRYPQERLAAVYLIDTFIFSYPSSQQWRKYAGVHCFSYFSHESKVFVALRSIFTEPLPKLCNSQMHWSMLVWKTGKAVLLIRAICD